MAKATANPWQQPNVLLAGAVLTAVVIAGLYWAQIVFVPVALSMLLVFLLTPPVRWLERRGLGRPLSVSLVVVVCLLIVAELGWLVGQQISHLGAELPDYSANVQAKVKDLQQTSLGFERLQRMIEDVTATVQPPPPVGPDATVVVRPESNWMGHWPKFVGSAVEGLAIAALVCVLTIFGLFKREDLRNRFLRLMGHHRVAYTTKAVDEAAERLSRYLLTQAIVNVGYGVALALLLGLVGVRYALLWGAFAAVLRYIPYVGAWLTMLFPMAVSIATAETWMQPLAALGSFLVLEVLTYNLVEPLLFKRSMGVSEVAQLVSAAFWGFLWGPIGLVLSAPLTVCLLVIGKYVPQLAFLEVLLGDDPPLESTVSLYQRLLARDEDDAAQLVAEQVKKTSVEAVLDDLLVPVLSYVKRDRTIDEITQDDQEFILRAVREIVDDLAMGETSAVAATDARRVKILACPAFDETDVLALEMLGKTVQLGGLHRFEFEIVPTETLSAEVVERAAAEEALLVCIGSVLPGGLAHTRYLCKRVRQRLPEVKILAGRWGQGDARTTERDQQLIEAGADTVASTLQATRQQLHAWLPIFAKPENATAVTNQTGPESADIDSLAGALAPV